MGFSSGHINFSLGLDSDRVLLSSFSLLADLLCGLSCLVSFESYVSSVFIGDDTYGTLQTVVLRIRIVKNSITFALLLDVIIVIGFRT